MPVSPDSFAQRRPHIISSVFSFSFRKGVNVMAKRSNIIVEDNHNCIQLYRHYDGYPEAVLPDLHKALPFAWTLPRFEATDFAAAIVRVWKEPGVGNIYIEGSAKGWETISHSIAWIYLSGQKERLSPNPCFRIGAVNQW